MAEILSLPQRPLITGRQLSERLGVSYVTIRRWSSAGDLADLQIKNGIKRYQKLWTKRGQNRELGNSGLKLNVHFKGLLG